jgi:hypothetical protein
MANEKYIRTTDALDFLTADEPSFAHRRVRQAHRRLAQGYGGQARMDADWLVENSVVYQFGDGVLHTTLSVVIQSEAKDLTESNREMSDCRPSASVPRTARNDK